MQKTTSIAHGAVLLTNIFFAVNYSLVKFISPALIGAYGLNLVRVGISVGLFWVVFLLGKSLPGREPTATGIQKQHLGRFLHCGLTGVAVNQMLFIKGLTLTSTIHASLLMLSTPLLITIFAFWVLKEKLTVIKILGLLIGIGGASLLLLSVESGGGSSLSGDILLILNAIAYAFYFILVKPLMQAYSPLHVMRWVFTFGLLMIVPFGWSEFAAVEWPRFEHTHLLAMGFIVVCGTFLAYSFNIFGIRHLGAGITGSYIYTQPLFTGVIAVLFLGEEFTIEKIVAGLLIFTGVFLVSKRTPPVIQE